MAEQTAVHLDALTAGRGTDGERGSCAYNLTLINCMEPAAARPDLKQEPTFGTSPCSVSWHADSSLEHFSAIAVYHQTGQALGAEPDWRIGLRVFQVTQKSTLLANYIVFFLLTRRAVALTSQDAEGPTAGKFSKTGGGGGGASAAMGHPLVAVPLESGAAYYLLDDFNHHHQVEVPPRHCIFSACTLPRQLL